MIATRFCRTYKIRAHASLGDRRSVEFSNFSSKISGSFCTSVKDCLLLTVYIGIVIVNKELF